MLTGGQVDGDELVCVHCVEIIDEGDLSPVMNTPLHRACAFRLVGGSVGHQRGECSCYGRTDTSEQGLSKREAARRALEFYLRCNPEIAEMKGGED